MSATAAAVSPARCCPCCSRRPWRHLTMTGASSSALTVRLAHALWGAVPRPRRPAAAAPATLRHPCCAA